MSNPNDWELMYHLIAVREVADAAFGSRFHGRPYRSLYFHRGFNYPTHN
jgi:hypothetical protein